MYKQGNMVLVKEILSDYKEDYQKAIKLLKEEIKNDPPNERFRSSYAAKVLLLGMHKNLENALAKDGKNAFTYKVLLAFVQKDLGSIYDITNEPTLGEKYFKRCIKLIEPHKMCPEAIIPYIGALNGLGNLLAVAKKSQKAIEVLKLSEQVYNDFKASGNAEAMSITDLFGTSGKLETDKGSDQLEKLYTQRAFYIAQVYGHLNELDKFTMYCHEALRRQLESNSHEPFNFASNVANLSRSFLFQNMFKESRHHLAVATWIMADHESKMITPEMSEATIKDVKENFNRQHADLALSWVQYGLTLLKASTDRLYRDDEERSLIDIMENLQRTKNHSNDFRFANLKQLEVYENSVSTEFCLVLDDSKLLFRFIINWLDQAKAYYKLDTKPIEYAGIIKDYIELYKHMAFFQETDLNHAKMFLRSCRYYEELTDVLNPTEYLRISRECWYGAGLLYCAISEIFPSHKNASPSLIERMNEICRKAIKNLLQFQKSYTQNDGITLKPKLNTEEIHAAIRCHFHLGSLYYKMVTPDPALQLENMNNSLKHNKRFAHACKKYKKIAETMKEEIRTNEELAAQLPLKIANIKKRL